MQKLVQAYCVIQSGHECSELDFDGTTDWYRSNFIDKVPVHITVGMDAPQVPLNHQVPKNATLSTLFCPYRPFTYDCMLEKQTFHQTVHTKSHSSGWTFGQSTKVAAKFGVEFMGSGGGAGPVVSYSFAYSFQDAKATATTEQTASVQSMTVKMDPSRKQCLLATSLMGLINAKGTQKAYISAKGWVGMRQDPSRLWKLDIIPNREPQVYRAMLFEDLVWRAKQAGVPEAKYWVTLGTPTPNVDEARIVMDIDLEFNQGTSGFTRQAWNEWDSAECKRYDLAGQWRGVPSAQPTPGGVFQAVRV